ncbi:hypothetical protein ILUMI_13100 [Ignelater luminosus]|uniref:HTH CENPB-type domain-containing protein n=1 Tax=Ignelater luminosus TaxID=2038154 RepID=A0A8K0CV47_IGNLU|nr:hypothetical protein ILUMI_13100 [Ignelater luminosus]
MKSTYRATKSLQTRGAIITQSQPGRLELLKRDAADELVMYFLEMERKYFGLTRQGVRRIAFQLAKRNSLPNTFSLLNESVGKNWLHAFLKRHTTILSIRKPTGTLVARAVGTRGRKCGKSKILTSMPNKDELEESTALQREKVVRRMGDDAPGASGSSNPRKKLCKPRTSSTSSSESEHERFF